MQLLFVDPDRQSARALHGEFLGCRGFQWDLTHCESAAEATSRMEQQEFQVVLYRGHDAVDGVRGDIQRLLNQPLCPPIVSVLDHASLELHFQLIEQGVHDSLSQQATHGVGIMRQLRKAEQRQSVWQRRPADWNLTSMPCVGDIARLQQQESEANQPKLSAFGNSLLPAHLHIAHIARGAPLLQAFPADADCGGRITFEPLQSLEEFLDRLAQDNLRWHGVLLEQSAIEEMRPDSIRELAPYWKSLPTTVLTLEKSDYASLAYLDRGFTDCIVADPGTTESLGETLCKSIIRHRRHLLEILGRQTVGGNVSDRRKSVRAGTNRRQHVRYLMQRPFIAIPMLPGGAPDRDHLCNATSLDISLGGIGLSIPLMEQIPSRNWIVGMENTRGECEFISAYLRRVSYHDQELRMGLVFQTGDDDFFAKRNLRPELHPDSKQFKTHIPENSLTSWLELGVLSRDLVHRVRTCPACDAICGTGRGCSECGSHRYEHQELIHHFACAHVDLASEFHAESGVTCPKCLRDDLVVGADFEIIRSRYHCPDCGHVGNQLVEVGACLHCQLRFPLETAAEKEIAGYHVRRLDVLALVDDAR